ncbi:hypothetical protein HNR65_001260 [Desulfosalsimonas propionicica]|uniref:Uncharacterized protein n=1 Tax=Desulfosalsimonas propionicica TaxID=332175 RepID=A0A7W0C839_9BACT|nr:hypothetical protein [Desulfosalsimonas propionicica]MBA2880934.1 hypothetical protein [Desulfosalsimonas propionicica]
MRTCVSPEGSFIYGIHSPAFSVKNFRSKDRLMQLGVLAGSGPVANEANFPEQDVDVPAADKIFEVPNAFAFHGVTYINTRWADENAKDPVALIRLPEPQQVSFGSVLSAWQPDSRVSAAQRSKMIAALPGPLKLALAETGTDPEDLMALAVMACDFVFDPQTGRPDGLVYRQGVDGRIRARIHDHTLFEALANNPCLPEIYRQVMVLRPGVQGANEIVGEYGGANGQTHVYEYLRSNSYIAWGHYAANMAEDAVRYSVAGLTGADMRGMRHLYYQRTYARLAQDFGIAVHISRRGLEEDELEDLRLQIRALLKDEQKRRALTFNRTLWGWNYGFDSAPSGYRLHASHQQIHQQYAMIPKTVSEASGPDRQMAAYAIGDQVETFVSQFFDQTGVCFFDAYIAAIENNQRMDGAQDREQSLIVYRDENVMVFVPKAQTSQWELQVMAAKPVGHIAEADTDMRRSLDAAILTAAKALCHMGAKMITFYEVSRRMDTDDNGQRLFYVILPRLPESPGAFSEFQLRWINGHYPEDFAAACRAALK